MPTYNPVLVFHIAACSALGIDPQRQGAQTKVAALIGEHRSNYHRSLTTGGINRSKMEAWLASLADETGVELELLFEPEGRVAALSDALQASEQRVAVWREEAKRGQP